MQYELGDWDDVLRATDAVASWERERGRTINGILAPPFAVKVMAARGQIQAAAPIVADLLPRARRLQDPDSLQPALTAAAVIELAQGDPSSALSLVEEVEELTRGRDDFLRVMSIPDLGRVCAATAELSLLERLLQTRPPVGVRWTNLLLSGRAILAEARGEHSHAQSLYEQAAQGWKIHGSVIERAYALLGLSQCRLALRHQAEAASSLHEARQLFARLEARPLLDELDRLLTDSAAPGSQHPERKTPRQ